MKKTEILRKFILFCFYLSIWITAIDKFALKNDYIFFNSTWLIGIFTIIAFAFLFLALLLHIRSSTKKMNQTETFCFHLGWGFLAYCFFRIAFANLSPKLFPWSSDFLVSSREKTLPLCYFFIPGFLLVLYSFVMRRSRKRVIRPFSWVLGPRRV